MFKTTEELEKINAKHLKTIIKYCNRVLEDAKQPPAERPAPAPDADGLCRADTRDFSHMGEMLKFKEGQDHIELTINQVMDGASFQHEKTMETPWYVNETSNKDVVMAQFLLSNAEQLIKSVPIRCKEFNLLAEQRLAILAMGTPLPEDVGTALVIPKSNMHLLTKRGFRKEEFRSSFYLQRMRMPMITIATMPPGSGKSMMACMAAFLWLVNDDKWNTLQNEFRSILYERRRDQHSGLVAGTGIESLVLARLCIAFVPATVLTHWYQTAESAAFGMRELYGDDVDIVVWRGRSMLQSIEAAYESGRPTLLILPMETESLRVLQKTPNIMYAVEIRDELNFRMSDRRNSENNVSTPLFRYVTQATVEKLTTATHGQPHNFLRKAFGDNFCSMVNVHKDLNMSDYASVEKALNHLCKLRQFAVTDSLRRLVGKAAQRKMPSGLNLYKLETRASTLAHMTTGSLLDISLADLAMKIMKNPRFLMKEHIETIFNEEHVVEAETVLRKLDELAESLDPQRFWEITTKQSIVHLSCRLKKIFAHEMPRDPIDSNISIAREDICLLRCCTGIISKKTVRMLQDTCPLCHTPLTPLNELGATANGAGCTPPAANGTDVKRSLSEMTETAETAAKKPKKSEQQEDEGEKSSPPQHDAETEALSSDDLKKLRDEEQRRFLAMVRSISEAKLKAVDAVISLLMKQCQIKRDSRILLCFGFQSKYRNIIDTIIARIRKEVHDINLTDIDRIAKDYVKSDDVLRRYNNREKHKKPQVLLINTADDSSSVQGLNLFETDLTIVGDQCSKETQRQAAGRCLRMQPLVKGKPFGPKNLVVVSMDKFVPDDDDDD